MSARNQRPKDTDGEWISRTRLNPAERLAQFFTGLTQKYVPEPFVLAIGLTFIVGILAMAVERQNPLTLLSEWGDGFWALLAFTMQMALVLAFGYVLAHAPFVDRQLDRIAARLPSPRAAVAAAVLLGGVGSYLNWGFGLVVGSVVATKFAMVVPKVHYPLIIAAAYSGFTMYGFGFSSAIPVTISTEGHPLQDQIGLVLLTDTIFSWPMVITSLITLTVLVIVMPLLHPSDPDKIVEIDRSVHRPTAKPTVVLSDSDHRTVADRLNNSKIIGIGIGVLGLVYLIIYFAGGNSLDINIVNFGLLFIGLVLMKTPLAYVTMMADAVKTIGGILLQYPFYAGIMAIMATSGLVTRIGEAMTDISTPETLPTFGLLASFVINFFAPSAGGHWVIQGPFQMEAAANLGSSLAQNAMAVQLGNAWQDLVQPLWILPVLAISRLKLKDIMGYLVVIMLAVGVIYVSSLLLWGFLAH